MADSSIPLLCISDVHGMYYTLVRLLNAAPKPCRLILLGDLIDRGPNSREVVEFAMQNCIPTCMGNHEDLLLAYSSHAKRGYRPYCAAYYDRDVWLRNGGRKTLSSWDPEEVKTGGDVIPKDVLDWMQALPPYIVPDAPVDENGRKILLSHTGFGLDADQNTPQGWLSALWGRHVDGEGEFPEDNYFRTVGHTRVPEPVITERYAYIDSGAAYGGGLTGLLWPSKEILYQQGDETPTQIAFHVESGGCIT